MNFPQILYWVYFMTAAFSAGCMAFAGVLSAVSIKKFGLGLNSVAGFRVLLATGYSTTVLTLLWLTLGARVVGIQPSPEYFVYVFGLMCAGIGALGLAFKNVTIYVALEQKSFDAALGMEETNGSQEPPSSPEA